MSFVSTLISVVSRPANNARTVAPAPPRTGGIIAVRPAPPRPAIPAPANSPTTIAPAKVAPWSPPVSSLDIVREIADVMQVPPAQVDSNYINSCIHAASYLNNPVNGTYITRPQVTSPIALPILLIFSRLLPVLNVRNPQLPIPNEAERVLGQQARTHVLATIEEVAEFSRQAQGAGFAPPSNPYTEIARLNAQLRPGKFTPLAVTVQQADDLLYNIKAYVDLLEAWHGGAIDLRKGTTDKAQLAHVRLSFDGFGGSGNGAADILKFLPSLDDIKKARADQALSVIDFSKRTPYLLFTLDYVPHQGKPSKGTIIGWKKIPDASGYILKRHDVFAQSDYELTVDNQQVKDQTAVLMDYVRQYALSMLNPIDENSVMLWLDPNVPANDAFVYRIAAYQVRAELKGSVFDVSPVSAPVTAATKAAIQNELTVQVGEGNQDLVSPWPAIAQQLLGDAQYDWLLAAVNVRASINRGDPKETTRKYSYLNAQRNFLFTQADQGKLVQPNSEGIGRVINNVSSAIEKYGVNQVVQELLDETGITYYFDGRDPHGTDSFTRAGTLDVQTSPLFSMIGSAIDPDTATLDLKSLASNLPSILGAGTNPYSTTLAAGTPSVGNDPKEIAVEDPNEANDSQAEGNLQFVNQLGDLRDSVIDLTTYDGLAKLMRTIRVLSDFGPDRIKPKPTNTGGGGSVPPIVRPVITAIQQVINATGTVRPTTRPVTIGGGGSRGGVVVRAL